MTMLNNLVNAQDLKYFIRAVRTGRILHILRRLLGSHAQAVQEMWANTETPPIRFWDVPAVHRRANRLLTDDPNVDYITYLARKYLTSRGPLIGLSLGCGIGLKELTWAGRCNITRLDAYDLSAPRIAAAQEQARARGMTQVHFHVGDIYQIDWPLQHYDVVFSDQAMHHCSPLEPLCANIRRALKPDGYLIVSEYVGPARFQWTDRQIEVVNGLLAILPQRYRTQWEDRAIKKRLHRPSRLRMILADPSEAVESDKIIPTLERHFEIVERRDYGGTIIHPLFADIAANFQGDDPETQRLIDLCFQVEDTLLALHDVPSDFALLICQPLPGAT